MKYIQQRPSNTTSKQKKRQPAGWLGILRNHWQPITAVLSLVLMTLTLVATLPGATNETYALIDKLRGQSSPTSFHRSPSEPPSPSPTLETHSATADEESSQADSPTSGCYDGATPTPCDSPHSREVFAKPAGSSCDAEHASEEFYDAPEEVNCNKKYEDFSGRPVDHSIRVTRQPRDHRIVCRAEVQVSTDRLTASVRDLENATLPIKQN